MVIIELRLESFLKSKYSLLLSVFKYPTELDRTVLYTFDQTHLQTNSKTDNEQTSTIKTPVNFTLSSRSNSFEPHPSFNATRLIHFNRLPWICETH